MNLFPSYFQYENPATPSNQNQSSQGIFNNVDTQENHNLNVKKRNSSTDVTPASSEFEFCTNDATKGSDEDDDQTISTEVFPSFESFPSLDRDYGNKSINASMDTLESPTAEEGQQVIILLCFYIMTFF